MTLTHRSTLVLSQQKEANDKTLIMKLKTQLLDIFVIYNMIIEEKYIM